MRVSIKYEAGRRRSSALNRPALERNVGLSIECWRIFLQTSNTFDGREDFKSSSKTSNQQDRRKTAGEPTGNLALVLRCKNESTCISPSICLAWLEDDGRRLRPVVSSAEEWEVESWVMQRPSGRGAPTSRRLGSTRQPPASRGAVGSNKPGLLA